MRGLLGRIASPRAARPATEAAAILDSTRRLLANAPDTCERRQIVRTALKALSTIDPAGFEGRREVAVLRRYLDLLAACERRAYARPSLTISPIMAMLAAADDLARATAIGVRYTA